jgi:hypothetical protein
MTILGPHMWDERWRTLSTNHHHHGHHELLLHLHLKPSIFSLFIHSHTPLFSLILAIFRALSHLMHLLIGYHKQYVGHAGAIVVITTTLAIPASDRS